MNFKTEINDELCIIQNSKGLVFGTDALLLSAFVKKNTYGTGADLGAGSGIISLLLAKRNKLMHIYAVEIQAEYAAMIKENSEINGLNSRITAVRSDLRELSLPGEVDVVVTNPPYMTTSCGKRNTEDIKYIARHEVFGGIADFCRAASVILKHGGLFYAVYRPERLCDLLFAMRDNKIEPKRLVTVYPDDMHEACLVLVEGKKGAAPSLFTPMPLLMSRDGKRSRELEYIYENGEFDEQYKKHNR